MLENLEIAMQFDVAWFLIEAYLTIIVSATRNHHVNCGR